MELMQVLDAVGDICIGVFALTQVLVNRITSKQVKDLQEQVD